MKQMTIDEKLDAIMEKLDEHDQKFDAIEAKIGLVVLSIKALR